MNANPPERPQLQSRRNFLQKSAASLLVISTTSRAHMTMDQVDFYPIKLNWEKSYFHRIIKNSDVQVPLPTPGYLSQYSLSQPGMTPRFSNQLESLIRSTAQGFRLDPVVLKRLVLNETGGQSHLVSPKWAQGLTQIMPVTQQDFLKRMDVRYVPILKSLPKDFHIHFLGKDTRSAIEGIEKWKTKEAILLLSRAIFDPEVNLFLGGLYLAGLKQDVENEKIENERTLAKITGFSSQEVGVINKHRSRIWAPVIRSDDWIRICTQKLKNADAGTYIEALARYNGGNFPAKSAYGYASSILI